MNGMLFHYCHPCVSVFFHMRLELYYRSERTNQINGNAVEYVGLGNRFFFFFWLTAFILETIC